LLTSKINGNHEIKLKPARDVIQEAILHFLLKFVNK
jgi:hypothetical protein